MEPFTTVQSVVTPLDKVNVDTDQIIPKQFLKLVQRTGFGRYLFFNWRFDPQGMPNPDFVLNMPRYASSKILAAGENFGCGSSREHAVWALLDYGFRVVLAPSFGDIFYGNCFKNGLLPVRLAREKIALLGFGPVRVNLADQVITAGSVKVPFETEVHRKKILLDGLDDISLTLKFEKDIESFEHRSRIPSIL